MLIVIILISFLFVAGIISDNSLIKGKEKISVIVKLKEPKKDSNLLQGFVVYDGLDSLDKKYYYSSTDSYLVSIDKDRLEALKNNENIEFIYEEQIYHAALQDALPLSNITIVHELLNLTGKGNTICILDTGINYSHKDFGSCSEIDFLSSNCTKIIAGYDFVNNDNNSYDDNEHGTHVSGIVSRTAPDAKIISVKILDENGSLSYGSILMKMFLKGQFPDDINDHVRIEFIVKNEKERENLVRYFRKEIRAMERLENFEEIKEGKKSDNEQSAVGFDSVKFTIRPPIPTQRAKDSIFENLKFERIPVEVQILTLKAHEQRIKNPEIEHKAYKERQFRRFFPALFPKEIYEKLIEANSL